MSSYNRCLSSSIAGKGSKKIPLPLLNQVAAKTNRISASRYAAGTPPTHDYTNEVIMFTNKLSTTYNDRQMCLINYLESRVKEGKNFFKSNYIARETGLSSKEVGTNMGILAEICPGFKIQKYSYSNSTTWLITPSQS